MSVGRLEVAMAALVFLVLGAGPTVGDVGSCSRTATPLDEQAFADARKALDCQRCAQCGLATNRCHDACDPNGASSVSWPPNCFPLEHDGEVCLRALQAAGCSDYAAYVDDVAPSAPTECDFCQQTGSPSGQVVTGH